MTRKKKVRESNRPVYINEDLILMRSKIEAKLRANVDLEAVPLLKKIVYDIVVKKLVLKILAKVQENYKS